MKGVWKLTYVEMKLYFREPIAAFFTLIFPLLMLLLFGAIYGNKPSLFTGGMGYVDNAIPALTALIIATSAMLTLPIQLASYREKKILRRLKATPIRPYAVFFAQVTNIFLMTTMGMIIVGIAGKFIFNAVYPGYIFKFAAAYLFSCLSFFVFGFILAGLFSTTRAALLVGMAIFYPMIFLGGTTVPLEVLPQTLRNYSRFLPLTQVTMLLRGLWQGEGWKAHSTEIIYLAVMIVLGLVLSRRIFRWE
ncbi:MAG: ABC transporter permease [Acidobacteria bacterium]|jgi:ABC-2 type transport system permease protein|nr:ABC transporter permease [Acidobacteriota bacterium]